MNTYSMEIAGLRRELPICKVTDSLYIGAFICFGDAELTVACARELLKECERWAKEEGCQEFASDCEIDNEGSRRFHEAMNFTEANRIICFIKKL